MRGFGSAGSPKDVGLYTIYAIAADMLAILQHLGVRQVGLVGHDHGANVGWKLSVLHPEIFVCYLALSVPWKQRSLKPPLQAMREKFGDESKPEEDPEFFYMLHHNLPTAGEDYARHARSVFLFFYGDLKDTSPLAVTSSKLFVEGQAEPMFKRSPMPRKLASWISEEEVEYYVQEFARAGWEGGMNWYRVLDMDWHITPQFGGAKVQIPVAFVAGTKDLVVAMNGGVEAIKSSLGAMCEQLETMKFVDGAGHWIQQECAAEVNVMMLEFMGRHQHRFTAVASRL
jgi:pimeloyl-ACP methyl ester carboxylesterase